MLTKRSVVAHLLCRRGLFLGRKSAKLSNVNIPATYPFLLILKFPSKSLLNKTDSSCEMPLPMTTATKQTLLQPLGLNSPDNIAANIATNNLSILSTKSKGNEYSGKKVLQ